jgi:hypothetical protein
MRPERDMAVTLHTREAQGLELAANAIECSLRANI